MTSWSLVRHVSNWVTEAGNFQVSWPFGSGEEGKNRVSRWWPSWISIGTVLAILDLQVNPMRPTKFQINWPFGSGEEAKKIDFQDGSHLGYPIGTILAIFDLPVTLMLPTKFRVNWPLGSREDAKNRYLRWLPWRPSWISDQNDFSFFWSTSHLDASYQVSSQLAFRFRRSKN